MAKRIGLLVVALILSVVGSVSAYSWPPYENTVRSWGNVVELYSTTVRGRPWVAFVLAISDGTRIRFDCDAKSHALACDQILPWDSILVSGHQEDRLSCHWDGVDNFNVPNVLWRCGTQGCTLLTP